MAEISNGVWFDTKTNTVVDSAPEEGVQIVAPGQEMTPTLEADVKRYSEQGDGNKPAATVTTADVEQQPDEAKATAKTTAKK